MYKRLRETLISIPEIQDLPIWCVESAGFNRKYSSVNRLIQSDYSKQVNCMNLSVFKDLLGEDRYCVAFTSQFEVTNDDLEFLE